ncbi:MAG: hypothetical protein H7X95_00225 [Deltaproteobacteria bacterium]|nr:hypothetical protein [Deltaproteobacteria bacterium]
MMKRIALPFLFALTFTIPAVAHAQRRSPLADAPAIRKRVELRETRLQIGAGIGSTINQTFYHGVLANVHLGFHITDWLSVSGMGAFNVTSLSTGFREELITSLPADMPPANDFRAPTKAAANVSINKPSMLFGGQVELTPFAGKFATFGALFAHYDFYVFGGAAGVNLVAANSGPPAPCSGANAETCLVSGWKVGGTFGAGFHSFFNNFLALNVELRDFMIKDNPAGRDVNGDGFSNNSDLTWTSHLMATIGLAMFLPSTAAISP